MGYLRQRFISEPSSTSSSSVKVGFWLTPTLVKNILFSLLKNVACFFKASLKSSEGSNKGKFLSTFGPSLSKYFVSRPVGSLNFS